MNRIDKFRKKKGLSYGAIGKTAGLSAAYISMLAKGARNNPSLNVMCSIANALGEKVEKVFDVSLVTEKGEN